MPHPNNPDELGSLWQKKSAKGVYFTGTILGQKVVIFANTNKRAGSNQPDWRVLKSKPRDEAQSDEHTPSANGQPLTDDDIQF